MQKHNYKNKTNNNNRLGTVGKALRYLLVSLLFAFGIGHCFPPFPRKNHTDYSPRGG